MHRTIMRSGLHTFYPSALNRIALDKHEKELHSGYVYERRSGLEPLSVEQADSQQSDSEEPGLDQPNSEHRGSNQLGMHLFDLHQLSFEDFCRRFHAEEACFDILYAAKWPDGYSCPRCQSNQASLIRTRRLPLYQCLNCHYQASLTTGTIMEGSRTPLNKWFRAVFLFACPNTPINAVKLAAAIEVTYKTAWLILHKLRFAMSQSNASELLGGIVRVNAAVYGRPYNPTIHRHKGEHPLLVGASINRQGEPLHIKIKQVQAEHLSCNSSSVLRSGTEYFIKRNVTVDADITVETKRYNLRGFQPLLRRCKEASNWINTIYHGIGPKHLQAYLDEFCFKLNHSLQQESAFHKLFQLFATTETITYAALTRSNSDGQYSLRNRQAA
ncbi:transposase [Paenibacillus oenotherae]|uniref:Transposase n=1 Tax=Paenibacillus oenotherae TaxID=1435645 RepID=A0ABS7D597_9BACL|nr:transposase [Paenibacillus oenotherae]MBW7475029.1 transposase [Paenibacillus oenotherae]